MLIPDGRISVFYTRLANPGFCTGPQMYGTVKDFAPFVESTLSAKCKCVFDKSVAIAVYAFICVCKNPSYTEGTLIMQETPMVWKELLSMPIALKVCHQK